MWRKLNPPHVTTRQGRPAITDFPLEPDQPKDIVELVSHDHPDHPINKANRAEEEKARQQSLAAQASPVPTPSPIASTPESRALAANDEVEPASDSPLQRISDDDREFFRKLNSRELHELHCTICAHPFRAMLEEEFLHWISPDDIAERYEVGPRAIYRHAHATGLYDQRFRNLRSGLAHFVAHAMAAPPTARDVIHAIHHLARINSRGQWIEPTKRVVLSSDNRPSLPPPAISPAASPKHPRRARKAPKRVSRKTR